MTEDDRTALLDRHISQLEEHFDTVQIFVSAKATKDGTEFVSRGGGNWFARYGQVQEWLIVQEEEAREKVRQRNREG